ncbi:hypothetical protein OEV98_15055 [Caldibacillus lycopersici]|uniref:Uncharacterized protein n=1 Tax=Perspicuibacillus lycopersici TaxID=1325689 RepID=A0AAE3LPD1_9BACI|nr:hypothetical protein [Perspicuibacillus lycopersici]MCU9614861.1 hypothetical protein [Perspicuibacillus lycopersici]
MIERIRMHGVSNEAMLKMLETADETVFSAYGEGIPDWQTLITFYENNQEKVKAMIQEGYQISFLTKGALKNLLRLKYCLLEQEDFDDCGDYLEIHQISEKDRQSLKQTIAKNWTIIEQPNSNMVKIELTYKPEDVKTLAKKS